MASSEICKLAHQLLTVESNCVASAPSPLGPLAQVIDILRFRLTKLAGAAGFRSLLSRALVLARLEAPVLKNIGVTSEGGLEDLVPGGPARLTELDRDAECALVAQLLQLLITFVGEPLTLRLVRDAWPDVVYGDINVDQVGTP